MDLNFFSKVMSVTLSIQYPDVNLNSFFAYWEVSDAESNICEGIF
jgi:hypothetical protein